MRIAAFADIHGNLPALEAVLAEVRAAKPDLIVCCGDVVPGPMTRGVIERLMSLPMPARFVHGNTDRELVAAFDGMVSATMPDYMRRALKSGAAELDRRRRDFLAAFEDSVTIDVAGLGTVVFCHGSPRDDDDIITIFSPWERLEPMLARVPDTAIVVGGHSHRQFDRSVHGHRIINTGSVGSPYEGHAAAFWLFFDPQPELRVTEYDIEAALHSMSANGADVAEMFQESLITPKDPDEVARYFEDAAVRRDVKTPNDEGSL